MLLHACCGDIIETILASDLALTVLFYNPDIQPRAEYDRRKAEVIRLVRQNGATFVDADDYDPADRQARTRGRDPGHEAVTMPRIRARPATGTPGTTASAPPGR